VEAVVAGVYRVSIGTLRFETVHAQLLPQSPITIMLWTGTGLGTVHRQVNACNLFAVQILITDIMKRTALIHCQSNLGFAFDSMCKVPRLT
jgi:hypothetical protein